MLYPSLEYFTTIISSMYRQGMEYATYSPKVSVNPISVMGWVCDGAFYMWKKSGYRYRVCRYQRANSYQVYRLRNRIIFRHTMTTNLGKSDNRKFLLFKMHIFSFKNLGNFLSVFVYFSLSETLVIFNNVLVLWDAYFP